MKPAPFEYHRPRTLDEAAALLAQYGGDAKILAGGQSLIPAMNFRLATPAVLIDLNHIEPLAHITAGEEAVRIGAMTRHRALETSPLVAREAPLVTAAMPYVAHAAIRTRGTVGGSLAHADPAAELPAVMLALDATMTLVRASGTRRLRAADFFTGLFATALDVDEMLTQIDIPAAAPRTGVAFAEMSRRHGDYALAGAAASVTLGEDGRCTAARIALLSVGDRPLLAEHATRAMLGEQLSPPVLRAAAEAAAAHDIDPPGDIHASSAFRRHLAGVMVRRALERASAAAPGRS